ncbi:hypothetical protein B0C18_002512 [Salmonella enterica]|nr:hypothetical protein [Salmonella enterica]
MPGGAALTGPTSAGWIRQNCHPAECYTHLNPYELTAIIRRNSDLQINPFLVGFNDAEGIFFICFNATTLKEVRT